jgi:hypothetical protein
VSGHGEDIGTRCRIPDTWWRCSTMWCEPMTRRLTSTGSGRAIRGDFQGFGRLRFMVADLVEPGCGQCQPCRERVTS